MKIMKMTAQVSLGTALGHLSRVFFSLEWAGLHYLHPNLLLCVRCTVFVLLLLSSQSHKEIRAKLFCCYSYWSVPSILTTLLHLKVIERGEGESTYWTPSSPNMISNKNVFSFWLVGVLSLLLPLAKGEDDLHPGLTFRWVICTHVNVSFDGDRTYLFHRKERVISSCHTRPPSHAHGLHQR